MKASNRYFGVTALLAGVLVMNPAMALASCSSTFVPTPNVTGVSNQLFGVGGSSPTDIWAVGDTGAIGNFCSLSTLIDHSNGSTWSISPSPNVPGTAFDRLESVTAVSPSNAFAVGQWSRTPCGNPHELSLRWDGHSWTVVPSDALDELSGVSSVPGKSGSVWAVGTHQPTKCGPNGCDSPVAKRWDANTGSWVKTSVPTSNNSPGRLSAVISLPGGKAWAVGSQGNVEPLVVHWNGTEWTLIPNRLPHSILTAIFASSDADVWTAAVRLDPNGFAIARYIEHWNGSNWSVTKLPDRPDDFIAAIGETSAIDVWAASSYFPTTSIYSELPLLEHYDGTSWSVVPTPANGVESGAAGLYLSSAGLLSVGTAWPAQGYSSTTYATISHC